MDIGCYSNRNSEKTIVLLFSRKEAFMFAMSLLGKIFCCGKIVFQLSRIDNDHQILSKYDQQLKSK